MRFCNNQPIICYFEPFLNFDALHLFKSKKTNLEPTSALVFLSIPFVLASQKTLIGYYFLMWLVRTHIIYLNIINKHNCILIRSGLFKCPK